MILLTTHYKLQTKQGFTLLEVLLSVALITLVAGFALPVVQAFQNRNDLDLAVHTYAHSLRRALLLSRVGQEDSGWGVRIATSTGIVIFKGSTYASRDANFDETSTISSSLQISGVSEVAFAKFTGLPSVTGTTTLLSVNSGSSTVTINAQGMLNY